MKVLFVSGNRERLPDPVVPLGVLYLASNLPQRHARGLIDLCFEQDPHEALRQALQREAPDVVAVSMRNIQNNDYSGTSDNIAYYAGLLQTIRDSSEAFIVLGGSGFSVMPAQLMQALKPDYGIPGEGERAFAALLDALESGSGLEKIGALHYWSDGAPTENPRRLPFLELDTLSAPDRGLVDPRYYTVSGIESVQTKRGCPLVCDYCTYPLIEGRNSRLRAPSLVVDEMFGALDAHPEIKHFFIVDSVFNLPRRHARAVCEELIRRRWTTPWTCYANPLGFDRAFVDLAREAGCIGMEIGSDSGSDRVLERLRKGFDVAKVRELHSLCVDAGIMDCHTFILGTEGETLDDVRETLEFAVDLDPFGAIMMIWVDDYEALDPALKERRLALRQDIEALLRSRRYRKPGWSVPSLGINFNRPLFEGLRSAGLRGPLWQHTRSVPIPVPAS